MSGKFVEVVPGLEIHYREAGAGPLVLLLVPGWTMDSRIFSEQLAYFADGDRVRAIALDPRGHGLSSCTDRGHSYAQHGRDLYAFIEALDLENVVLCGWSFATLAVLACVHFHGVDRLAGLIMLDGPPRAVGADNHDDWVTYRRDDSDGFRAFFTNGPLKDRDAFNREFARWMLEFPDEEKIRWISEMSNQLDATAASRLNESSDILDYRQDLVSLEGRIPLMYVMREERGTVVREWAAANTPSAAVHSFGKHLMFLERSEEFNAILTDFLESIGPLPLT